MNKTAELFSPCWRKMPQIVVSSLVVAGLCLAQNSVALTVTAVTSDNGYPAHQVQWKDSAGATRTAIMVDQNLTTQPYTGYLRRYTYQANGSTRVCTGTQNYAAGGNLEFSGDGFVQNHTSASDTYPSGGDFSSGNGAGVPGTTTITLQGTSHAIITYSMPNYQIVDQAGNSQTVPTTVQWFFADGRSHPIFAISQDASGTSGNVAGDSRSPYGDMAYDGDGIEAYVGGCSYGDTYKFVTLAADPEEVTEASGWMDTEANTIPYAMQWAEPATVDAEMGHVATVPISICDQGEDAQDYPVVDGRGNNQLNGPMLTDASWAFQILNDNFPASGPTTIKRLTWGANYGRVGGWDDSSPGYTDPRYPDPPSWGGTGPETSVTQYNKHYDDPLGEIESGTRVDGMLMAYSVFIVFGTHTGGYENGTVGQQVIQMQNVTQATLSASTGSVVTTGPAGVGNAANSTISYSPLGYNPTYAIWEISASGNAVNATLTPATGFPLDHPVFVIDNYTKVGLPSSISVGGLTTAGVDYFASVDTAGQRLWITVNSSVSAAFNLVVSEIPPPVISSFTPTSGTVGTPVTITGTLFTGATAVAFNGVSAAIIGTPSATSINTTVPAGATTGPITVTAPGGTATSAGSSTPTFTPKYNLSVFAEPSASDGTVTAGGITGGGSLPGGPETLIATAANGFIFTNWTQGGTPVSATATYNITLNADETFGANFLVAYTLTVGNLTPGGGSVSSGGVFAAGSTQTVTATPNAGYVFSNWTEGATVESTSPSYNVTLNGNVTIDATFALIPPPQLEVLNETNVITNGQTSAVDFGSVQQNQTGPIMNFTVTNSGGETLYLGTPTVPPGYTLVTNPPATIAAGDGATFSVQLNSTAIGTNSGDITITNNANNVTNSVFSFPITGLVNAEIISLSGNLAFGGVALNTSSNLTLTIGNAGNAALAISNISYPPGFSGAFSNIIAAGGSTNVTVTFSPAIASNYSGTVTVSSDASGGVGTIPISGFGANGTLVLTIDVSGDGSVSPNLNGQTFNSGTKHTIRAILTAGSGEIFAGWTGSTNSTKNPLTFAMQTSTVLEANFIPNPFLTVKGTYNGLFFDATNGVTEQTAGMLKGLAITQKGTYSGTVLFNGGSHAISGAFDANSQASNNISRPARQGGPLAVVMTLLNPSNSAPQVTGTVSGTNNGVLWVASQRADRATNTVPPAEYTLLIPPDTNSAPTNSPGGDGYALITNRTSGASITGALADGTAFNQTVPVSQDGYVPLYANLYSGKGLLMGWINLDLTNTADVGLTWIHPPAHLGLYAGGFTNVLLTNQILLSPWTNISGNIVLTSLSNLSKVETTDDTNGANYPVTTAAGKVTGTSVNGTINSKTGLLTVTIGSGASKVTGHGAILLNAGYGGGYFLTKTNAEGIELNP